MKELLAKALEGFKKRANNAQQTGKNLNRNQVDEIQKSMGFELPEWYVDMMMNHKIINIEHKYPEYEDMDRFISIANYNTILSEINDAYPGIDVKPFGYVNFGTCMEGSGNPIFINLKENDNPPVIRVYHDGFIENGVIDKNGGNKLSDTLSDYFDNAEF